MTTFTLSAKPFLKALNTVGTFVEKRFIDPFFDLCLFVSDGTRLRVASNNLDFQAVYDLGLSVPVFNICVEFKALRNYVKTLGHAELSITIDAGTFIVNGFGFATAADFPPIRVWDYASDIAINPAIFGRVQSAVSAEKTRYYLNGVFVAPEYGKLCLVATDGHRLKHYQTDTDYTGKGVIIPRDFTAFLAKQSEGILSVSSEGVRFVSGALIAYARVIEGSFPDYNLVIPRDNDKHFTVSASCLTSALKTLDPFHTSKSKPVKFTFKEQKLVVSIQNIETGEKSATIPAAYDLEFEGISVGFDATYILDLLASFLQDEVTFAFSDAASPVLVKRDSLQYVLMPLRV